MDDHSYAGAGHADRVARIAKSLGDGLEMPAADDADIRDHTNVLQTLASDASGARFECVGREIDFPKDFAVLPAQGGAAAR